MTEVHDLPHLLELEPHGPDVFVGDGPNYPWGRVYGGRWPPRGCGRRRPPSIPITACTRCAPTSSGAATRAGPSATRSTASATAGRSWRGGSSPRQSSSAILNLDASFQTREDEVDVQAVTLPPDLDPPESVPNDTWGPLIDRRTVLRNAGEGRAAAWMRLVEDLPEDPMLHECGLTYLSDDVPMEAALDLHPRNTKTWETHDEVFMSASLDHCVWFHRPARPDDWLLFDLRSSGLAGGRGLSQGEGVHRQRHPRGLGGPGGAPPNQVVSARPARSRPARPGNAVEVVNPYQQIADVVLDRWHGEVLVAGIAGPVGVGKSTHRRAARRVAPRLGRSALVVSTDGFLFSNAELDRRGPRSAGVSRTRTTSTGWARSCGRPRPGPPTWPSPCTPRHLRRGTPPAGR